jgi:Zn-dependent protease
MVFITLNEIIGIIAVTVIVGYILSGYIQRPKSAFESLYKKPSFIDWDDLKFSMIISAPAIILHELGHKFVGMAFGLPSIFKAFWGGLGLGVVLKMIGSPFIVLAPAYVQFAQGATPLQHVIIAFAGPGINLILWLGSAAYIKFSKNKHSRNTMIALMLTKKINMILFIFNMIPFPPLDGYHIFSNLYQLIL